MSNRNIAIYIRLSMADEVTDFGKVESESIVNQRMYIHRFLDENQELSDCNRIEYVDDGYTATNGNRPQFTNMIEQVQKGDIQVICVKDFSRFFRDYIEAGNYLECVFPFLGVRFISINDHYDSENYKGTTGGLEMVMRNIIYASYSKDLSVKVKSAKKLMMEQGKYLGGHPTFGYALHPNDKYQLVVDEDAAKIVRFIFDMALEGKNTGQIAKYLNKNKAPTKGQYFQIHNGNSKKYKATNEDSIWTTEQVRGILKNYLYTGAMVGGKQTRVTVGSPKTKAGESIIVENTHEAIVTKEEFDKANLVLQTSKSTHHRTIHTYPLKGFIRCSNCKRKMEMRLRRHTPNVYVCKYTAHNIHSTCSCTQYSEEELEQLIFKAIQQNIFDYVNKKECEKKLQDKKKHNNKSIEVDWEKKIADLKKMKLKMYEKYVEGNINREMYLENKQMIDLELEAIKKKNNEIPSINQNQEIKVACNTFFHEDKLTREMMLAFVNTIYVSEDCIEIKWKFSDIFF